MTKKNSKLNFEDSLNHLEQLVEALEEGELSLEESLKAFEQGIKLTRECQQALAQAEQKVQMLIKENEQLRAVSLEEDDLDGELDDEDELGE